MATLEYTPLADIDAIHAQLDATFRSGKLKDIPYRKYVILQLGYMLKDNADRIAAALLADLGKPPLEVNFSEIGPTIGEAVIAYNNVDKWAKPDKPPFSLVSTPLRPVIYKEGKGICLVVGPFNYPVSSCIGPIISAIAAGNTVVFKPSEMTPAIATLFVELFAKYIDPAVARVVNGGVTETTKLLELPWGHIMFTGSGRVGKIVGEAAARTFTPVTLELGGKSPVFVDPTCDLESTARRLLWGKTMNSGQTCVAPDYVLVPKSFQETLVQALTKAHEEFFPDGPLAPQAMAKMVSAGAFKRVYGLLERTKGTVVFGGQTDEATKAIAPTVVKDCTFEDSLMSEEIFGPILPIIPVESLDEGIAYVNRNDRPLALYAFTSDSKFKEKIVKTTLSGSVIINDTVLQAGLEGLPFGGVGHSGSGFRNGKFGFDVFTHLRASFDSHPWVDKVMRMRYPPYTEKKTNLTLRLFASLPKRPAGPPPPTVSRSISKWIFFVLALVLAGGLTKRKVKF